MSPTDEDICWPSIPGLTRLNAYRIYVLLFNMTIGVLVFYNVQKTKLLQMLTTVNYIRRQPKYLKIVLLGRIFSKYSLFQSILSHFMLLILKIRVNLRYLLRKLNMRSKYSHTKRNFCLTYIRFRFSKAYWETYINRLFNFNTI